MFFPLKSLLVLGVAASQVSAHVIFTVDAASDAVATTNDVTGAGSCNVEEALAGSTVSASASGAFTALAKWFNQGTDGATTIKSATFDVNADGKAFAGTVSVVSGGVANQAVADGTDKIELSLPAGTTCQGPGGACLVQLSSTSGFGNCVAVIPAAGEAGESFRYIQNSRKSAESSFPSVVTRRRSVAETTVAAEAAVTTAVEAAETTAVADAATTAVATAVDSAATGVVVDDTATCGPATVTVTVQPTAAAVETAAATCGPATVTVTVEAAATVAARNFVVNRKRAHGRH
ncbi:hypothetical protein BDY24DRAFT_275098 [Mrakia frigida]|uniref:uncharacterized protein n=1 Tax=Mrakia frigida TaxID=29902 RepID=UPI003FCC1EC6